MTNRVQTWLDRLNHSTNAMWVLFWASFAETIIVPIPIELVLIPFMIAHRDRLWLTASVVLAGCLAAAIVGYGIGYFLFDTAGAWLIDYFGYDQEMREFRELFQQYGFWAVVALGVIPIPFQTAMLVAGAAQYPIPLFVAAAVLARGIRYYGLALLVRFFGERAERMWKEHKTATAIIATLVVAGAFGFSWWLG